jgi:hypothetical protein
MSELLTEKDRSEIELSIEFGKRWVEYEKEILQMKLKNWDRCDKYDQYCLKDRSVIIPLIADLEQGNETAQARIYKKMLTVVGATFFSKELKQLDKIRVAFPNSNT